MFFKGSQLSFVVTTFCYEIGHYARQFLPIVVSILKISAGDVCAKDGEKIGTRGSCMPFEA